AERLVGTAAGLAREALVLSFPREGALARAANGLANLVMWATGQEFRSYVQPHRTIVGAAERQGLELAHSRRGLVWHVAGFVRRDGGAGRPSVRDTAPR